MSLLQTFENSGNVLFRYRGQIPFILFIAVLPVIYFTNYTVIPPKAEVFLKALSIVVCLIGFFVRVYTIGTAASNTSGRNTKEQVADSLNTTGIYSVVRHPLYLGNYLMWAGITMYVLNLWFFVIVSLFFWVYYERIMFAEERFLERKFRAGFLEWSSRVPAFFPSFREYVPSKNSFSFRNVIIKEYSGFIAAVMSFIYIEVLRDSFHEGRFIIDRALLVISAVAIILVLVLRIISKQLRKRELIR